ncbi:MAG: hypothetical protein ACR2K2_15685 [Mycobacteriales bacterium]
MGSGLILLVIVGAWLAVLVPMALRSHDVNPQATVDKFHDAMRVLSRRGGSAGVTEPAAGDRPAEGRASTARREDRSGRAVRTARSRPEGPSRPDVRSRAAATSSFAAAPAVRAARRRRVLTLLVTVALLTLVGALAGPRWLFAPHLVADVLIGAYLGYLRHETILRAEREWRTALGERHVSRPAQRISRNSAGEAAREVRHVRRPAHIVGVPERLPSRATVTGERLVVEAVRTEEPAPAPARGAQGGQWSPVPVPLPIYLTEPVPRRTASGDQGAELEEILDQQQAVND